jgi:hypothetical protein
MRAVAPVTAPKHALSRPEPERPRLELSGPKLAAAFERLVSGSEEHGGIERYVIALQAKSAVFRQALERDDPRALEFKTFKTLCALSATVRRRVTPYLAPAGFQAMRSEIARLLAGRDDTSTTDQRMAAFCGAFPEDREHRWVRDLAAEILHAVDPERYPMMCRWVWDAKAGTGVLREIWHASDADPGVIEAPSCYGTYLMLREELSQFLAANGVFRDVIWYVDLLTAQVYADYIGEQGGTYLRTEFGTPEDSMHHLQRLLGLDGVDARGRTRLKAFDGEAFIVDDVKLLD